MPIVNAVFEVFLVALGVDQVKLATAKGVDESPARGQRHSAATTSLSS